MWMKIWKWNSNDEVDAPCYTTGVETWPIATLKEGCNIATQKCLLYWFSAKGN